MVVALLKELVMLKCLRLRFLNSVFFVNFRFKACNFIKKEALAKVFSSEFWEIS